jgi:hypothetical protein
MAQNKKTVGHFQLPTALTGYNYFLTISQQQWVDFGIIIPIKIIPTAKI